MLIEVTYGTTIRIGAADNSSHNCFVKLQHREIANPIWKKHALIHMSAQHFIEEQEITLM